MIGYQIPLHRLQRALLILCCKAESQCNALDLQLMKVGSFSLGSWTWSQFLKALLVSWSRPKTPKILQKRRISSICVPSPARLHLLTLSGNFHLFGRGQKQVSQRVEQSPGWLCWNWPRRVGPLWHHQGPMSRLSACFSSLSQSWSHQNK